MRLTCSTLTRLARTLRPPRRRHAATPYPRHLLVPGTRATYRIVTTTRPTNVPLQSFFAPLSSDERAALQAEERQVAAAEAAAWATLDDERPLARCS